MKKIKLFVLTALAAILLSAAITAVSQLGPVSNILTKVSQVTPDISLEKKETCITKSHKEVRDVMGSCIHYYNYTHCLNTTGLNTACSSSQNEIEFECRTGEKTVLKDKKECKPDKEFTITVGNGAAKQKKQIDFSDWGPCVHSEETIDGNSCLVVTCVSLYDGAHKGQFTDCNGGKSCQRFEICENSIKKLYKNSREDFVEDDESFHLGKLDIAEVSK